MAKKIEKKHKDEILDLPDNPEQHKVRVNMFVDGDVVLAVRKAAKDEGIKYQTLINKTLREFFVRGTDPSELNKMKRRIEVLENLVNLLSQKVS